MRIFIPAASMAIIASSAASTRGLGIARQIITTTRFRYGSRHGLPPTSSAAAAARQNNSRRRHGGIATTTTSFRRATGSAASSYASFMMRSACFVSPPDGATTETSPSAAASATSSNHSIIDDYDDDDDDDATIERTARESLSIIGNIPPVPSYLGDLPYLDTSTLDSSGCHRVIFVLGGPGAGKGTQCERIVNMYKCVHLSVGELLRIGANREDYAHADLIRRTLVAGNIVPVELSLGLLREAMDEASATTDSGYGSRIFLVDGFPRNYDNVRGWMECMPDHASVFGALVYDCPMEELERRILGRAETSGRTDDNLISARKRFDTFRRQTVPVVRALERAGEMLAATTTDGDDGSVGGGDGGGAYGGGHHRLNIVNIDASGSVEEVWKATKNAMDAYVKNDVLTANAKLLNAIDECDVEGVRTLSDEDELLDGAEPIIHDGPPSPTATTTTTLASSFPSISNGRVDIVDGIRAIVSYDRRMKDGMKVRETRVWKHGSTGWKCVGVTRV